MKVGTITYSWAQNWGAVLQAYALVRYLNNEGYDAQLIDYREFDNKLISTVKSIPDGIIDLLTIPASVRRIRRYNEFRQNCLRLTKKCKTTDDLKTLNSEFDVFITGSDQVWNVGLGVCKDFYLHFAEQDKKTISYAASFGVSEIPEQHVADTISGLGNIDYISVRENSGKKIVESLTSNKAEVVLDPVFLLNKDQWLKVASNKIISVPYIFVYPTQVTSQLVNLVKKIKKETGMIAISPFYVPGCKVIKDIGPREFIRYVADSKYVVASSFHATAFSMIFNKPLACITHSQTGSRTTDLLKMLNLEKCIVHDQEEYPAINMDFSQANILMKQLIDKSVRFIKNALGDKNEKIN